MCTINCSTINVSFRRVCLKAYWNDIPSDPSLRQLFFHPAFKFGCTKKLKCNNYTKPCNNYKAPNLVIAWEWLFVMLFCLFFIWMFVFLGWCHRILQYQRKRPAGRGETAGRTGAGAPPGDGFCHPADWGYGQVVSTTLRVSFSVSPSSVFTDEGISRNSELTYSIWQCCHKWLTCTDEAETLCQLTLLISLSVVLGSSLIRTWSLVFIVTTWLFFYWEQASGQLLMLKAS